MSETTQNYWEMTDNAFDTHEVDANAGAGNSIEIYKPRPTAGKSYVCRVQFLANMDDPTDNFALKMFYAGINREGKFKEFPTNKFIKKNSETQKYDPLILGNPKRYGGANNLISCPMVGVAGKIWNKANKDKEWLDHLKYEGRDKKATFKKNSLKRFVWVKIVKDPTKDENGNKVYEGRVMPMQLHGKTIMQINNFGEKKGLKLFNPIMPTVLEFTYTIASGGESYSWEASVGSEGAKLLTLPNEDGEQKPVIELTKDQKTLLKTYLEDVKDYYEENEDNIVKSEVPRPDQSLGQLFNEAAKAISEHQPFNIVEKLGNPTEITEEMVKEAYEFCVNDILSLPFSEYYSKSTDSEDSGDLAEVETETEEEGGDDLPF